MGYYSTRKNILCPTVGVLSFWCPESFKCAFIQWRAEVRIFEEAIMFETWPFKKKIVGYEVFPQYKCVYNYPGKFQHTKC